MRLESYFTPFTQYSFEKQQALWLLIRFIIISGLFAVGYFGFSFITGFLIPRYLMLVSVGVFIALLYLLKARYLSLGVASHIFVIVCWLIVVVLTLASGAAFSYVLPWVSLIPVMALVLLSRMAAWCWSLIGVATVIVFLFVRSEDFIPTHLLLPANDLWIASLHIGLQSIMLTLTYIFSQKQSTLISTIEKQNDELRAREQIIEEQHRQLQVKNEGLESEIENRTRELVRNNQQLEQFNFIASHNLRAPIARILGLAQLLNTPLNAQDESEIRHRLLQSTHDLDQVVRDLNTILSIRKSTDLTLTRFSLADEWNRVCADLEKEITDAEAIINTDFSGLHAITCVRPYLHSVLMNLLSNAIKYRKPGRSAQINIQASLLSSRLNITVQDNGIGMDVAVIKNKIFTLYSRFHTHVEGRGLGLYLAKTQIEAMGGTIHVSSAPNQGTTFSISLPQPD